jgi:FkbM family methyltransferase
MRVGIYGAGQWGRVLYKVLIREGIKVDFFIDQYKNKSKLFGIPIYKLDNAPKEVKIFVSIPSPTFLPDEIKPFLEKIFPPTKEELQKLGFKEVYSFDDLVKIYPQIVEELIPFYRFRLKPIPQNIYENLQKLFTDKESLRILQQIKLFREMPSSKNYPFPSREIQYFPPFIREQFRDKKVRFVDMGAFKGDTIAWLFYIFKEQVEEIIAFEPIKEFIKDIFQVLEFFDKRFPFSAKVIPAGVWEKTTILRFQERGASTSLSQKGKNIPVFKPDDVLLFSKPNFIKIDIEGAELPTLKGMENTIKKYKPLMAISVYHRAEDLWEIPFWIKEKFPFYWFKLRLHGHMLNEIILYCIPQK